MSAPAGRRIVLPAAPLVDGVTSLRSWSDGDLPALAETGRDPDVTRWMVTDDPAEAVETIRERAMRQFGLTYGQRPKPKWWLGER